MIKTLTRYFDLPSNVDKQESNNAKSDIKTPITDIAPGTKQGKLAINANIIEITPTFTIDYSIFRNAGVSKE